MSPRQFHSASFLQRLFNQSPSQTKPYKLDLVNGLGTQLLGKDDRDIYQVISTYKPQVNDRLVPNPLANQVIAKIKGLIPWVEQVRFGHSREELYPIVIGLAIAYTGRSKWVVCGPGMKPWGQDLGWGANKEVVHQVAYNDLTSLEQLFEAYPEEIGAIILEPIADALPTEHFFIPTPGPR
ncbi:MAG: hypothetical protein HC796_12695 [Synechococcaceae cyanobacterium RL_1_2]|nr:hypothetical protein [Synechococcaceae cyanobacterium RL_1_2]